MRELKASTKAGGADMVGNTLFTYGLTEQEKDDIYAELDRADEQDSIRREQEELEQELREEILCN